MPLLSSEEVMVLPFLKSSGADMDTVTTTGWSWLGLQKFVTTGSAAYSPHLYSEVLKEHRISVGVPISVYNLGFRDTAGMYQTKNFMLSRREWVCNFFWILREISFSLWKTYGLSLQSFNSSNAFLAQVYL